VISLLFSAFVTLRQVKQPTTLDNSQLQKITEKIKNNNVQKPLESIQSTLEKLPAVITVPQK
jgi:hypothetical protein